ncbi:UNVERIFIED_CONTAM: hypothetical protein PYX00_005583 [Menopon gallinae]|uniref:Protein kinase domain-containing protein n=1 Tax=Menopon gallinae TaxID=328185 RepID=A0AAW2HRW1_9NEOP
MFKIDEDDPVGELTPSFPYRDVQIRRGVDVKEFYDLQEEIGRGKFGTVYKCQEKATGLRLAAKFVATSRKEDKRNVEREIDIMRSLQHPRLIQLYDAFERDKTTVVVLELIEGGELFERVIDDDFVLTERSCTVFMRQICEGMEFIHKQNILHLDMKPENILCLTKTGNRIKIIDFGLARKYDPDKKLQVLFGTPEFVAPEVVNFDRIGFGTDMWSIGVICYVLLSGLSPFMGETDIETMANVTISKWDFDDDAFLEISDDAKDFISNLLVKDKEKRLTATQCLSHPWLRRKPAPIKQQPPVTAQQSDLDLAKDNLKFFVERWNEHPNSPYLFDTSYQTISPCVSFNSKQGLRSRTPSSSGCSPSPCGSISSLLDSPCQSPPMTPKTNFLSTEMGGNTPTISPKSYYLERLQHFDRRASDSSCLVRNATDVVSRINLAEEIKKLSDKLLKINRLQLMQNRTDSTDFDSNLEDRRNINIFQTSSTTENSKNGSYYFSSTTTVHRSSVDLGLPKRKFKFSSMNRDVPIPVVVTQSEAPKTENPPPAAPNPPSLTSNLLQLLDKYENEKYFPRGVDSIHRKSLSVEWSEIESLGQRTMKNVTNFIETSRNAQQTTSKVITSKID